MKYCPECQTEYRDGFEKCADCNCLLSGEKPLEAKKLKTEKIGMKPVLLFSASSSLETKMKIAMLEKANIPTLQKKSGLGDYEEILLGIPTLGVDVYVDERQVELAKMLLSGNINIDLEDENEFEDLPEESEDAQEFINNEDGNVEHSHFYDIHPKYWSLGIALLVVLILFAFSK